MTKVEQVILEVAKKNHLNININKVDANLKTFGIDSLAAMNLIIQVEEKLNKTLDDNVLMQIKTLGDLIEAFSK